MQAGASRCYARVYKFICGHHSDGNFGMQAGTQQTREQAKEYARMEAALTSAPGQSYGPIDEDNLDNADNLDRVDMEMSDDEDKPDEQAARVTATASSSSAPARMFALVAAARAD